MCVDIFIVIEKKTRRYVSAAHYGKSNLLQQKTRKKLASLK